jgi:hypothetical protein
MPGTFTSRSPSKPTTSRGGRGTPKAEAQANLDAFLLRPVARAMPDAVKAELRRRGLRVP